LYGRGAVDAKGPLCAFAAALARIRTQSNWRVTVVGAVEEESATSRGARHVLSQYAGRRPEAVLIGEPSRWDRVTLGYKGRLLCKVNLTLPLAHSAGRAATPAERGLDLWEAVRESCRSLNERLGADKSFDRLDASLRGISTSDLGAFGGVEMDLAFRLPLSVEPDELADRLEDTVRHIAFTETAIETRETEAASRKVLAVGDTSLSLTFSGPEKAHKSGKSNALVRALLAAIRDGGGKPRFVVKTGTCDMNVLGAAWPETPMAAYGPGDSALDHTPDEHLELGEYLRAIDVLTHALSSLMESGPRRKSQNGF